MNDDSTIELSIDPMTGTTHMAEGAEVFVHGDNGEVHTGIIVGVSANPEGETEYTVLLQCFGEEREVTVAEPGILARATSEWDM